MTSAVVHAQPPVETLLPLTTDESRRLKECEKVIQRGLATFYEVGNALAEIRESRLYRIAYASFEDYCRERWQMSRFYAHRLIDASQVVDNLLPIGNIPTTESQARELAPFDPEVQKALWHIAIKTAPTNAEGEPVITAAHIRTVGNVLTEVVKGGGMDDGSGEMKPLGVLIDSAVTEETYERMLRQKEYIKEKLENGNKDRSRSEDKTETAAKGEPLLSNQAREFLDDYMVELARWTTKLPPDLAESERETLEKMIYEQGADALRLRNRTYQGDCQFIVHVIKETGDGERGDIDAHKLYEWIGDLRYFITEDEYKDRLEYMNREDVRMALLTDAGEGKQDDRRGKLPGIVCIPWRKVWNQKAKAQRDEDEEED